MNGQNNTSNFSKEPAAAFLNFKVTDANGNVHSLHKGIPLRAKGKDIERGLMAATPEQLVNLVKECRVELVVNKVEQSNGVAAL